jgi:hypothetical protein
MRLKLYMRVLSARFNYKDIVKSDRDGVIADLFLIDLDQCDFQKAIFLVVQACDLSFHLSRTYLETIRQLLY